MDNNTYMSIVVLCVLGWIPILALGKAVAMCIEAGKIRKYKHDINIERNNEYE